MRKFYLIGFALLLFFDTIGQTSFKLTANHSEPLEANIDWLIRIFTNPFVYIAIFAYISTFFTWMVLLKKAPVGPAFAASHLEIVTVMFVSIWVFNEEITLMRSIGAALIVLGIIFLALAEKEINQRQEISK
ncbi:EamA family transporter [Orbus wheelerorum]|uniref:DMT family transporter n=1 Tax=Orbus wheelerorum TaxID=3074111 RepID=UPI00370DA092